MVGSSETKAPGNQDIAGLFYVGGVRPLSTKIRRIESIDLLRGLVMIIMALDHVRDYFHADAFVFQPEDMNRTSVVLFFTRFITHYCAPVFVFLAGTSAFLYGSKRTKKELSFFLLTRGLWLVFIELFIIGLFRTFNPSFEFLNLQVIWVIAISMMVLSGLIHLHRRYMLMVGLILIFGHNLLDGIHFPGGGFTTFLWSLLHEPAHFPLGHRTFNILYPILPWTGLMAIGYYIGYLFTPAYDGAKRRKILFWLGIGSIALFIILRSGNFYGDASHWSVQKNTAFSILSFLNVTKYPPSLLYVLITIGPALVFLSLAEKPLKMLGQKIAVFGRVPMFYYLAHILFIHVFAVFGAVFQGYKWTDMIIASRVQSAPQLKGYGYNLFVVYIVWIALVVILYPLCKWYDRYKKTNLPAKPWLSYL